MNPQLVWQRRRRERAAPRRCLRRLV